LYQVDPSFLGIRVDCIQCVLQLSHQVEVWLGVQKKHAQAYKCELSIGSTYHMPGTIFMTNNFTLELF
jgi:hypothetical protein